MEIKGYEVVYYIGEHRVYAGNKETFPEKEIAERYKAHYENYPSMIRIYLLLLFILNTCRDSKNIQTKENE